ncbi:2-phosphoxylose phosphatase 1 isoform X1 [Pieris brassicae]|uniref:2-phosphoxylose phosphatase 1 isoform X1 n=1 Tax=Pieris brassicae TaxID=7116 RepID=UPI001E661B5A|nr:2-phosphoxylose phosphatase 1 isoform X1 [Pieris brassicae]XP_045523018.1 2-phosphoxylose phosphatase 1 isoform X1 [Pieris brassicae]
MKFSFQHRAFYCYIGMSIWIFFLITVVYKYITVTDDPVAVKLEHNEYTFKIDSKYRRIFHRACNPPEYIVRGSEGVVESDSWLLQGVLVITRHGDRGPLTHLKGGDKLPCDNVPVSALLRSYEEFVLNASSSGRAWWVAGPGPFHNFPSLPRTATTHCALGQLTPKGLLQMITVGNILREAYGEKLSLDNMELSGKKDAGGIAYSTRYRRTFQSLQALSWGGTRGAAAAREAHSVAFCFRHCACNAHHTLAKKISMQAKARLESHPTIKELIKKLSKVLFESQEYTDADVVRDALLAYMCHDAPLPCSQTNKKLNIDKQRKFRSATLRNLLEVDIDTLNMELDYINNQLDFNNEIGRKARDIIKPLDRHKQPLDFDAQMEREKLLYYQQRYLDTDYDDVVIVKKNLDADFNFPNEQDFDEEYREPTDSTEQFCVRKEHIISIFAYLEWSYRQDVKDVNNRRRSLLIAYGLIYNIVQNMIRMISENKPKFVVYSGHDKTLQALILALGLNNYQHYNIQYASRMIFEVYRRKDLMDEFKFTKRKAVAQDFYFRVVYNGEDVTDEIGFCKSTIVMKVVDPVDDRRTYNTYLCPIESIVRFIHDDYFAGFNVSNYKDACATYGKRV